MALPHHDTTHSDERRRGKTPLLRAEQAGNGNIAASADLTVGLHSDAAAKVVEHERLVGLGEA